MAFYANVAFASEMQVHFIDVGQADAALIVCDGHAMLIDGGTADDSSLVYTYLKNNGVTHLDYIVASHADADHIGGLSGALNYATVDYAFCPVTQHDTTTFSNFVKYLGIQGKEIIVPKVGSVYGLGEAQVKIIGPATIDGESNDNSLIIKITHGANSFLFTGDAEIAEEESLLSAGSDVKSDVLKVSHHGSIDAMSDSFLNAVSPKYAVISVGKDNQYGHPSNDVINKLEAAGASIYRTDLNGDIICISDGQSLSFITEKSGGTDSGALCTDANTPSSNSEEDKATKIDYILNTNTKKFHYPECNSVQKMKDKNKQEFNGTRDEAIARGYNPCGNCKP